MQLKTQTNFNNYCLSSGGECQVNKSDSLNKLGAKGWAENFLKKKK